MVEPAKKIIWNLFLMAVGSIICCVAINRILIPQKFFGAGFTGLSILIYYLFDFIPVSILYFVFDIPVFSLGWVYVGCRFFLYSNAGISQERMTYIKEESKVIYQSKDGKEEKVFDALEWSRQRAGGSKHWATMCSNVLNKEERMVTSYGYHTNLVG